MILEHYLENFVRSSNFEPVANVHAVMAPLQYNLVRNTYSLMVDANLILDSIQDLFSANCSTSYFEEDEQLEEEARQALIIRFADFFYHLYRLMDAIPCNSILITDSILKDAPEVCTPLDKPFDLIIGTCLDLCSEIGSLGSSVSSMVFHEDGIDAFTLEDKLALVLTNAIHLAHFAGYKLQDIFDESRKCLELRYSAK